MRVELLLIPIAGVFLIAMLTCAQSDAVASSGDVLFRNEISKFVEKRSGEPVADMFEVELNSDKRIDLLAGVTCGNAGCDYYCFEQSNVGAYKLIGNLFLHRKGFEIVKLKHGGFNDILAYIRSNVDSGTLVRYEHDGQGYTSKWKVEGSSDLFNLLRPVMIDGE